MTPQLQQAIKLLQLSRLELIDQIREELTENPILDEASEHQEPTGRVGEGDAPTLDQLAAIEERKEQAPTNAEEKRAVNEGKQEEYWDRFLESYSNQGPMSSGGSRMSSEDMPSLEATVSARSSLADHLLAQLRLSNLVEEEMVFATVIVNNLDDTGYLRLKGEPLEKKVEKKESPEAQDRR